MVDIDTDSLSRPLLESQGSDENEEESSKAAAGLHALSGTQGSVPLRSPLESEESEENLERKVAKRTKRKAAK